MEISIILIILAIVLAGIVLLNISVAEPNLSKRRRIYLDKCYPINEIKEHEDVNIFLKKEFDSHLFLKALKIIRMGIAPHKNSIRLLIAPAFSFTGSDGINYTIRKIGINYYTETPVMPRDKHKSIRDFIWEHKDDINKELNNQACGLQECVS
jgi:hypothetical protein